MMEHEQTISIENIILSATCEADILVQGDILYVVHFLIFITFYSGD